MSKVYSVNKDRVVTMNVNKNTVVNNVNKVTKVNKVTPSKNNTNHYRENFILSTTYFYDKLKDLKEDYKDFYIQEQELEKEIKKSFTHDDMELLKIIKNLVEKYNQSITYLKKIDLYLGGYYVKRISDILLENQDELSSMGITLTKEYFLNFNEETFKSTLQENKESIYSFFSLDNGLIKKVYTEFRHIKDALLKESIYKEGFVFDEKY